MILLLLNMLLVFFVSVGFHEYGHYAFAKSLKQKVKIVFEDGEFETRARGLMTVEQRKKFIMFGVSLGLAPILLYSFAVGWQYSLLLLPYAYGCNHDLKLFRSLKK